MSTLNGGTGAVSVRRSRPYCAPTACSSVSLPAGCANDRRRGVCGLHGAAAVALRGPLDGPVCARPRRAGAQGPVRCAVLPAPPNRLAGLVSAAAAPAPRRLGGHASPGGRNRWPGPAATGREPSARSTAGCGPRAARIWAGARNLDAPRRAVRDHRRLGARPGPPQRPVPAGPGRAGRRRGENVAP